MAVRQDASTGQMVDDGREVVADASPDLIDGKPTMMVKIYSPFHVYFNEAAFSITAANATGPFDILPRHHNFICLVSACELHIQSPQGDKRIRISGGVMHVKSNEVRIFLDV